MTFKTVTKAAIGAATVGSLLAGSLLAATPAMARDHRDNDGISAGEVIAGAVVLGGLAAILSSGNDRDDYRYQDRHYNDRRYDNGGYNDDARYGYNYDRSRYGNSRSAVNRCVAAVENRGTRYGRADVTEVRNIERKRDGYKVTGRVVVRDGYQGRWGQGRGGYNDQGKFSCTIRYGQVQDIRFSGLG